MLLLLLIVVVVVYFVFLDFDSKQLIHVYDIYDTDMTSSLKTCEKTSLFLQLPPG